MEFIGSDGIRRNYLLKPKEDLKQDERAMQLFSIINSMMAARPSELSKNFVYSEVFSDAYVCRGEKRGWVDRLVTTQPQRS